MFNTLVRWVAFFLLLPLILLITGAAIWWMGPDEEDR